MKSFNVLYWDFNKKEPEPYDIIPYLIDMYQETEDKPKTFEEFKEFIRKESMYQWWSRCQYELIIQKWPPDENSEKIDIHKQVMMNIDVITNVLMEEINGTCN